MLTNVLVSVVLSLPGGHPTDCQAGGVSYSNVYGTVLNGPPVVRVFERRAEDAERRTRWESYCRELDQLWVQYRAGGSTPEAWRAYLVAADQAKLRYVSDDLYFVPIVGR